MLGRMFVYVDVWGCYGCLGVDVWEWMFGFLFANQGRGRDECRVHVAVRGSTLKLFHRVQYTTDGSAERRGQPAGAAHDDHRRPILLREIPGDDRNFLHQHIACTGYGGADMQCRSLCTEGIAWGGADTAHLRAEGGREDELYKTRSASHILFSRTSAPRRWRDVCVAGGSMCSWV